MDFKFDFFKVPDAQSIEINGDLINESQSTHRIAKQIPMNSAWKDLKNLPLRSFKYGGNQVVQIYNEEAVEKEVKAAASQSGDDIEKTASDDHQAVVAALSSSRDVVAGVVEGGFTIWEGTRCLMKFLLVEGVDFDGKRVLDLGCGAGLLGIFALEKGAAFVTFQDFNQCVLEAWTILNVQLQPSYSADKVNFWSGDWDDFSQTWRQQRYRKFDIILTTETIYRSALYPKLLRVFRAVAASRCRIYVAGKLVYFGNDGSFEGFADYVERNGEEFSYRKVQLEKEKICYGCLVMTRKEDEC